jgi:hypothetical protein
VMMEQDCWAVTVIGTSSSSDTTLHVSFKHINKTQTSK